MADRPIIIAVDFDGCLCKNAWPEIGEARSDIIHALLERQKQGAKIILWTCRVGEHLAAAVQWCADHGITFDAVNSNLPANVAAFGNDCQKVFADEYWDDKAVPAINIAISQDTNSYLGNRLRLRSELLTASLNVNLPVGAIVDELDKARSFIMNKVYYMPISAVAEKFTLPTGNGKESDGAS